MKQYSSKVHISKFTSIHVSKEVFLMFFWSCWKLLTWIVGKRSFSPPHLSLKWDLRRAQEEEDEIRPLLPESAAFKRQGKPWNCWSLLICKICIILRALDLSYSKILKTVISTKREHSLSCFLTWIEAPQTDY